MAATISATSGRVTISGNYKAFTSTTSSTTTVIQYATGDAPASGDTGRFLLWKKGSSTVTTNWEIRKIVSATTTTVTVHDDFSSAPASGESFVISTNMDDLVSAVPSFITKIGHSQYFCDGDFFMSSGAFLACANQSVEWQKNGSMTNIMEDGTALQLGVLYGGENNNSTEATEGCRWSYRQTASTTSFFYSSSANARTTGAIINFYDSLIESFTPSSSDWIFQRFVGTVRHIGCRYSGPMGGRFYNSTAEVYGTTFSGNNNSTVSWLIGANYIRPWNNVTFYQNNTAVKIFSSGVTLFGGTLRNCVFEDSNGYIVSADATSSSPVIQLKLIDCTAFLDSKIQDIRGGIISQYRSINAAAVDRSGVAISGAKLRVADKNNTTQSSIEISDGSGTFGEILALRREWTDNDPSVTYDPFTFRVRKYDYIFQEFTSGVSSKIEQDYRLSDNPVTVLSEAAAAALTGIAINFTSKTVTVTDARSISQIYDYCQSQLVLDANMDEAEFLKSNDGVTFTFNDDWKLILGSGGDIIGGVGKTVVFGGTGEIVLQDAGNNIDGLTITGNMSIDATIGTMDGVTVSGTVDYTVTGSYDLDGCTFNVVTAPVAVTLNIDAATTVTDSTDPDVTVVAPTGQIDFTTVIAGSQIVVCETGTQTEAYRNNSAGISETAVLSAGTYDYTVMLAGYFPIRVTGVVIATSPVPAQISQVEDRAYVASSGLTFGTTATINTSTKEFAVTVATEVQNWYSFWIESWISESSLVNTAFPISTFGSTSFSLNNDYEFTSGSIQYLKRDGFRYVDSGNIITAEYCAILSQGVTLGLQAEYQQASESASTDAQNTGNVDQVIQYYGDATHGNFDYTNYLKFKVQANGYREARADVVAIYGSLEPTLYVIALTTLAIDGLTLGDPAATGITITKEATPVSYNAGNGAKDYSITILDSGTNSGETILRELNYNLAQDATYQSLEPFDWPEMIIKNGSNYETARGIVGSDVTPALHGVFVTRDGTNPHPDFTRFQADDGTYGVPLPTLVVSGFTANSRVRIYNVTTDTELYNDQVTGTTYSYTYTESSEITAGDTIQVRTAFTDASNSYYGSATTLATAGGFSVLVSESEFTDYADKGINGSTITEYVLDGGNIQIDVNAVDNTFSIAELSAWYRYQMYNSAVPIANIFDVLSTSNGVDYLFDTAKANLYLDNLRSDVAVETTGYSLRRSDGVRPYILPTTGGGGIDLKWRDPALAVETGVSGLTASESSRLFNTALESSVATAQASLDTINARAIETRAAVSEINRNTMKTP